MEKRSFFLDYEFVSQYYKGMRYFFLSFLITISGLCSCVQLSNDYDKDKSILWEISKNGSNQKSYLLGTYHGGLFNKISYAYIDSSPNFKNILQSVDAVGVECDFQDTIILKSEIENIKKSFEQIYPAYAFLPDSIENISQLFADIMEYKFVNSYLQELKRKKYNIPNNFYRLKPLFTIQTIFQFEQAMKLAVEKQRGIDFTLMDAGIYSQAKILRKHLFFMESAEYQISLLNTCPLNTMTFQEQAHALYSFCEDHKNGYVITKSYESTMQSLYLKGDLDGMLSLRDSYSYQLMYSSADIDKEIIDGRNQNWIPIILTNIEKQSCLIAVGAMHLSGERGLIKLLKEKGYEVRPIEIKNEN